MERGNRMCRNQPTMKAISLLVAWTWIAVPLGWGVYQSVKKSAPLFSGESKPAAPAAK